MSNLSLVKEIKDAVNTVLTPIHDLISTVGGTRITDLNKAAQRNSLNLYAVCSNTVSQEVYLGLTTAIEAHVANALNSIITATIADNAQDAIDFVRNNLTNADDAANQLKAGIQGISDGLSESGFLLENLEMDFSGTKHNLLSEARVSAENSTARGRPYAQNTQTGTQGATARTDLQGINNRIPGHYHTLGIPYVDSRGVASILTITLFIRVSVITAESEQVVDVIASGRNRNNFYNYLEHRAGNTSFFKGFVLNLREIKKQIKRDTSKDLSERILGSLLSKSGFTRPKVLADINEFRNFVLVISADDADRLNREHNINLTKASGLNTVFTSLNILSLMVVDEVKNRVSLYESNRPAEWTTFAVNDMRDIDRMARLFQNIR